MAGERERWHLLLPLFLGLWGMAASAVAALGFALDSAEFVVRAHLFTMLGLAASLVGSVRGRNPSLIGALIATVVFPLLVLANTGAPFTRFFFPDETLSEHSLLLPTLAAWGIIALSFAQVSRPNSIFIFVCGLVVFGLTGTININESLLISFFVFLMSAFFVWGYSHVLDVCERAAEAGQAIRTAPRRWAHTQVGVGAALVALIFGLSIVTGYPAYTYTPSFYAPMHIQKLQKYATVPVRNFSGFASEFTLTGGPITLTDTHILTVKADKPGLWRGLVYDDYDGTQWRRSFPAQRGGWSLPREVHEWPGPGERGIPRAAVYRNRQEVDVHLASGPSVFCAAEPVRLDTEGRWATQQDRYGCLHASRYGSRRRTLRHYTVVSESVDASPDRLSAAPADYSGEIRDIYIEALPAQTRSQLQSLADQITAHCTTPYEKVRAIEQYLYDECRYTLDVPPIPQNQDAVAYFLLKTRLGACDLYSSALAVLLRLSGVPARVATGFSTGEYDSTQGAFIVTGQDAHAWTEVYFSGTGWVSFDPPSQKAPDRFSWIAKLFQPGWAGPTLRLLAKRIFLGVLVVLLLNALVVAIAGTSPLDLGLTWWRRRGAPTGSRQQVALAYDAVCKALARRGHPRSGWQTPTEYARQIARSPGLPAPIAEHHVPSLTEEFLILRYRAADPGPREAGRFVDRSQRLARRIGRARRSKGRPKRPN